MTRLVLFAILTVILTACGGSDDSEPVPEATLEPTLTFEERTAFVTGSIENPVRIVIRPVDATGEEIRRIIAGASGNPALEDNLLLRDDLELPDDLAPLNVPLGDAFGVQVDPLEATLLLTVADVVRYVQDEIGEGVAQSLFDATGVNFEILTVDRYADALALVCESNEGIVSTAWLDGPTYFAALAQDCGDPALQVAMLSGGYNVPEIETMELTEATPEATLEVTAEVTPDVTVTPTPAPTETPEPTSTPQADAEATPEITPEPVVDRNDRIGTPGLLVVNRALGTGDVVVLRTRTFCRLRYDDLFTWFVPSLIMRENGVDPESDLAQIVDYDDLSTLVAATAEGRCTGMGLSEDAFEVAAETLDDETLENLRIAATSAPFPYGVFVYPPELRFDVRDTINTALLELVDDDEAWEALRLLLGQDLIVEVEEARLAPFDAYMQSTGLDFSQLGD